MIMCVTGHRPMDNKTKKSKLYHPSTWEYQNPWSEESFQKLVRFAEYCLNHYKPTKVITGMALGWDQAIAQACVNLEIPFEAYIPCHNQDSKWLQPARARYSYLMTMAASWKYIVDSEYTFTCMQLRNEAVVDDSSAVLALFDGSAGGTANCVRYAKEKQREIHNVWSQWLKFQGVK